MPRNRKLFISSALYEVTFRVQEGLPFIAAPFMRMIVLSYLAKAQTLYPVKIIGFMVMSNHVHMMISAQNPENIKDFVGYFKGETSKAINRLLGRRQRSVWCSRYDSPVILCAQKAVERLVYYYTNPQKAHLVATIDDYPNLSSWQDLLDGGGKHICPYLPRTSIPTLRTVRLSLHQQNKLLQELKSGARGHHTLVIEPNAWMNCFEETRDRDPEEIKQIIIDQVREVERQLRRSRAENNCPVVGPGALLQQHMDQAHTPKKFATKMICLSSCRRKRMAYIEWFKLQSDKALSVCKGMRLPDFSALLPAGMFLPGGFLVQNLLWWETPIGFSFSP